MPEEMDFLDEVIADSTAANPNFPHLIKVEPSAAARMICWATHPMALSLGTIAPLVRCCSHCAMYPAGHPTGWTWTG